MTKEDTKKMIMYLRTAYKGFCEDVNLTDAVNVWYDAFKNEDVRVMGIAARNYVKSSEYPPTLAGIQKQLDLIKNKSTDAELWALIVKATKNSTYGAVEEYEKLPPVCQKFIGSPTALKDLGQISEGTLETVVKGQFIKTAPQIREHHEVQTGLPMAVREVIEEARIRLLTEE